MRPALATCLVALTLAATPARACQQYPMFADQAQYRDAAVVVVGRVLSSTRMGGSASWTYEVDVRAALRGTVLPVIEVVAFVGAGGGPQPVALPPGETFVFGLEPFGTSYSVLSHLCGPQAIRPVDDLALIEGWMRGAL